MLQLVSSHRNRTAVAIFLSPTIRESVAENITVHDRVGCVLCSGHDPTVHRVNTTLIPFGEDRVSLPFFLLPRMEGPLQSFGSTSDCLEHQASSSTGYDSARDRGANASVNRMGTFPQVTKRWWAAEFKELASQQRVEVTHETESAMQLAKDRGRRNQESSVQHTQTSRL